MRSCNYRVWNVSPMIGLLAGYIAAGAAAAGRTPRISAQQALARWRTFPRFVDVEIANLREGLRTGYSEPKVNVRRVIESADRLLATTADDVSVLCSGESRFYSGIPPGLRAARCE